MHIYGVVQVNENCKRVQDYKTEYFIFDFPYQANKLEKVEHWTLITSFIYYLFIN